jgi:hypothetical protein
MSLTYALVAAVNGTTGLRAILLYGLVRTTLRRRRSGQHQPGDSYAAQAAAPAARNTPVSSMKGRVLSRGGWPFLTFVCGIGVVITGSGRS